MSVIQINLPESLMLDSGQSRAELEKEAQFLLALKLFELGRLSSGRAAALCSIPRIEFLLLAGRMGVPVADLDTDELDREFARA